jgi:hypothetical protein
LVRLGTCIALELAVAAGAVCGVWIGVGHMAELADQATPAAEASTFRLSAPLPLPKSLLQVTFTQPTTIFGQPDVELIDPLGQGTVTKIKVNHGGTSLSLRLDFSNGTRAAFKPEQTFPQSDPRREIAAYRIDRLLGINHVAPAKAVAIPYKELIDAASPVERTFVTERMEDAIVRNGVVHGEIQWWIPEIQLARLGRLLIDDHEGKELWKAYLQVGATIPSDRRRMVEQISTMLVYDVLIDNSDRWSGANVMMSPNGETLFFMDNTLAFSIHKFGHPTPNDHLHRIQVFSRNLVGRLRTLTVEQIEAVMNTEDDKQKLGRLLTPEQITAIIGRRDNILAQIDKLIDKYGEDAVLAFP